MDINSKINRKKFFKWASLAMLIPFFKIWQNAVDRSKAFSISDQTLEIASDLPEGTWFYDPVILVKQHSEIKLFSSKCTHLGCKINKIESNELVCPCHGSRYNLDGFPVKGPSVKQLTAIDFQTDLSNGNLVLSFKL